MNFSRYIVSVLLVGAMVFLVGCNYDKTASEPPAIDRAVDWEPYANFQRQADNAVLSSMVVTDIHFVPYRSQLNSLGHTRLVAIANYIEQYGGEVTVQSQQADEVTQQERLASVQRFLMAQGLGADQLAIVSGLGKGRGLDAEEATLFYEENLTEGSSSSADSGAASLTEAMAGGSQ